MYNNPYFIDIGGEKYDKGKKFELKQKTILAIV